MKYVEEKFNEDYIQVWASPRAIAALYHECGPGRVSADPIGFLFCLVDVLFALILYFQARGPTHIQLRVARFRR